ncbi:hypothetical protein B0A55_07384 [Friedmanniomyces simplex]|uniref:SAM-dependent MTase RsmB/NOP-type domain-containing protein n=1 Tax=Friedmanniomyces simplex TaxID=329884 RepID=A0A4V5NHS6_9PEZI|nr:hypothetical protein B0A55_07384 [Friedmanniomyces simplex]
MSLYHEAAAVLDETRAKKCSIKSLVYTTTKKGKEWKSDPKALFALSTEAAKWSEVLSEVVGRSGVLGVERTVRKVRRGFATLEALRESVNAGSAASMDGKGDDAVRSSRHPRWVRVNTLKATLDEQLALTFAEYQLVPTLREVMKVSSPLKKVYHLDEHIPNLIAIPSGIDITTSKAYRTGQLILQDKASCFPAYLLDPRAGEGDVIDACAAPGNKTTHLAAILTESGKDGSLSGKVIACEKDAARSETLEKMVKLAGAAEVVTVKAKQDFTKLPPTGRVFANVTALLLDPSCSGSGIVGRDEGSGITVHLPSTTPEASTGRGKKRKRTTPITLATPKATAVTSPIESATAEQPPPPDSAEETAEKLAARLANLSAFQLRLLEHAMAFPATRRIAYSTCSVHAEENEHVVVAALRSNIAREHGWRVMRRGEQVGGMRKWHLRGQRETVEVAVRGEGGGQGGGHEDVDVDVNDIAEACIRVNRATRKMMETKKLGKASSIERKAVEEQVAAKLTESVWKASQLYQLAVPGLSKLG